MKQARIRFLLIVFAAMFLANGALAAVRACTVGLAAHEHTATRILDSGGNGPPCAEPETRAHYLVDCTQCYKGDEQNFSFDTIAVAMAPPPSLNRVWFLPVPRQPVIVSIPLVVGPPLTILFGNLRI